MIDFQCLNCARKILAPEKTAGRKAKCPKCGHAVTVPTPVGATAIGIDPSRNETSVFTARTTPAVEFATAGGPPDRDDFDNMFEDWSSDEETAPEKYAASPPPVVQRSPAVRPRPAVASQDRRRLHDFLEFRTLVSVTTVKVLWVCGVVVIGCFAAFWFITGLFLIAKEQPLAGLLPMGIALGVLLVGNLVWRLMCEWAIVFFKILDELVALSNNQARQ